MEDTGTYYLYRVTNNHGESSYVYLLYSYYRDGFKITLARNEGTFTVKEFVLAIPHIVPREKDYPVIDVSDSNQVLAAGH